MPRCPGLVAGSVLVFVGMPTSNCSQRTLDARCDASLIAVQEAVCESIGDGTRTGKADDFNVM